MSSGEVAAIVLAAGEGKRMKSEKAKVLQPIGGRTMIDLVLEAIAGAGIGQVVVVTGNRREQVEGHLGDRARCVVQAEQKGTGHAVMQAEEALRDFDGPVLVACGDVPLLTSETLKRSLERFRGEGLAGLILSTRVQDPTGYGRIVRGAGGDVERIVEHKDASEAERAIDEINSGTYFFDARRLFEALGQVSDDNAQGEYYLTDVVEILLGAGHRVGAEVIDEDEARGVNSPEDLALAQEIYETKFAKR